jgi:manganese/zinc/iron transport system permease protein
VFAPFDRLEVFGTDIGPRGLYVMGGILLINVAFIGLFYKELKLSTFDPGLAAALGFAPLAINYALMGLVSVTVVGAFDIVGSVLVVALMVAPAAAAYLLTDRLPVMLGLSALLGALGAVSGYWLAHLLDASVAGSMAAVLGGLFALVFLFAPQRGMVAAARRRKRQREEFAVTMLAGHLLNHEDSLAAIEENRLEHLGKHLRWPQQWAEKIVRRAQGEGLIQLEGEQLLLTQAGREKARQSLA